MSDPGLLMDRPAPTDAKGRVATQGSVPPDDANLAQVLALRYRTGGARLRYLVRGLDALAHLSELVAEPQLVRAAKAESDYAPLVLALLQAQAVKEAASGDPLLAEARRRGIGARGRLLSAEGGVLTAQEISQRTGMSVASIDTLRRKKHLLAVRVDRAPYVYPAWQFDANANGVLNGLDAVLADLREHDPWMQLAFFIDSNIMLDDRTPLSLLRRGRLAPVRRAARAFGGQGAA